MPKDERMRNLISRTAARLERIIPMYPTRFHDIEAAKQYISREAAKTGFTYTAPSSGCSIQEQDYVKDKVHFVVAVKAFSAGEFYTNVPMEDKRALRSAIESDIARLLPLIGTWPAHFFSANMARDFVAERATRVRFEYTAFGSVEKAAFEGYVNYNTARHSFEDAGFTMKYPGYGWKEKVKVRVKMVVGKPAAEMKLFSPVKVVHTTKRAAIEADIHRLLPLLPSFPPSFPDINAARNHIQLRSRELHFTYTYWAGEDPGRFRLFVNFAAARHALGMGRFRVLGGAGAEKGGVKKSMGGAVKEEGGMRACAEVCRGGDVIGAKQTGGMARSGAEVVALARSLASSHSDISAVAASSSASSTTTISTTISDTPPLLIDIDTPDSLPAQPTSNDGPTSPSPLLTARQDPFRGLLAELEKVRVLDIAFG